MMCVSITIIVCVRLLVSAVISVIVTQSGDKTRCHYCLDTQSPAAWSYISFTGCWLLYSLDVYALLVADAACSHVVLAAIWQTNNHVLMSILTASDIEHVWDSFCRASWLCFEVLKRSKRLLTLLPFKASKQSQFSLHLAICYSFHCFVGWYLVKKNFLSYVWVISPLRQTLCWVVSWLRLGSFFSSLWTF